MKPAVNHHSRYTRFIEACRFRSQPVDGLSTEAYRDAHPYLLALRSLFRRPLAVLCRT
jgi:hypothetical protein